MKRLAPINLNNCVLRGNKIYHKGKPLDFFYLPYGLQVLNGDIKSINPDRSVDSLISEYWEYITEQSEMGDIAAVFVREYAKIMASRFDSLAGVFQ